MYIRRKVYSVLTDDYGQERLFSTNEVYLDDYEDDYVDDRLFADVLPAAKRAAEALNFKKVKDAAVNLAKDKNKIGAPRFAALKGKLLKNKKVDALGAGVGLATAAGTLASAASV